MRLIAGWTLLAAISGATPLSAADADASAELPGWMAGGWVAEDTGGKWVEEWWTPARAGVMLGAGRSGKAASLEWWEQTRIELADGKLRFCALPKGQPGACFQATRVAPGEITFENPGHDFPTRVAYRKEGNDLLAEISGPNGGNPQRWRFRRAN